MAVCSIWLLTACSVEDNPSGYDPAKPVKDYVEHLVPVTDPQGEAQGTVMLRFYDDMPNVAYVSISHFQSIMYPGTTVQAEEGAKNR